jgi:transcription elongation factor Elf1
MYFDHVRCPSCGAQFDPESIESRGGVASCPSCGAQLDVKSLFGVAAHLEEVDAPEAHIDDLVAGHGGGEDTWRTTSARDPMKEQRFQDAYQARRAEQHPPRQHSTSMVRKVRGDDPEGDDRPAPSGGPSAVLQALRDLKKDR